MPGAAQPPGLSSSPQQVDCVVLMHIVFISQIMKMVCTTVPSYLISMMTLKKKSSNHLKCTHLFHLTLMYMLVCQVYVVLIKISLVIKINLYSFNSLNRLFITSSSCTVH